MITGVANAAGCDPNKPWLETIGASTITSNASIASTQTAIQSNSLIQSFLSSSVSLSAAGPSSQVSASTNSGSNGLASDSSANLVPLSSGSHPTQSGTESSGSGSAPSGASVSAISAFSGSSSRSSLTSQTAYVNPNPFGCSEIM